MADSRKATAGDTGASARAMADWWDYVGGAPTRDSLAERGMTASLAWGKLVVSDWHRVEPEGYP